MATQVASLFGLITLKDELTPNLQNAKGGLVSFGDGLKDIGSQVTSFGAGLTALGAPFLALGFKAFTAFDEMDDAAGQLNAVLKSTGGAAGVTREEVLKMGAALQDVSTFTRASIVSGENLLLTFTGIGKTVFPRATQAMLDMSTAMGTDLKGSAIQIGKALNNPLDGITALTRVGVVFTDQQKEMIQSMMDVGDVAGAQGVILDELAKEFGGSAAAQVDTMSRVSNTLNDVFIDLGVAIQPVIDQLGNILIPILEGVSRALTYMTDTGDYTVAIIIALGASLVLIGPIIAGIGVAMTALGAVLAGPLIPIIAIVGGLVLLAQHFGITFEQIKLYGSLIKLYAEYYFQGVVTAIQSVIQGIIDFANANPELLVSFGLIAAAVVLPTALVTALSVAMGIAQIAAGALSSILGVLLSPVVILALAIGALLFAVNALYPGGLKGALTDAGTAAQQLAFILSYYLGVAVNWIKDRLAELLTTITNVITKIQDFKSNFETGVSGLGNILSGLTSGQFDIGAVFNAVNAEISGSKDSGGSGSAGETYMIGTGAQPELFVPNTSGTFYPNADQMMGGGVTVQSLTINASSEAGGRAAARGLFDEIEQRYKSRGGTL